MCRLRRYFLLPSSRWENNLSVLILLCVGGPKFVGPELASECNEKTAKTILAFELGEGG
jgi:hypothetical protein